MQPPDTSYWSIRIWDKVGNDSLASVLKLSASEILKNRNRIPDCSFLVLLVGLDGPCFRALTWALFNLEPTLRQVRFLEILFNKFLFAEDQTPFDPLVFPSNNYNYSTYSTQIDDLKLQLALEGGAYNSIKLGFYNHGQCQVLLKWGQLSGKTEPHTFCLEWTSEDLGVKYDRFTSGPFYNTYRIDLDRFSQVTNKFLKF